MINYLKDCLKTTLIGLLPDIINSNNESIKNEFNWIFDSSLNRLTKSVYAPTGSVKAHFGEFVNLACEYLTIKNTDSVKNTIQAAVEDIISDSFDSSMQTVLNHNLLNNRFNDSDYETTEFKHDAASIVYKTNDDSFVTVEDALNDLLDLLVVDASIKDLYDKTEDLTSRVLAVQAVADAAFENVEEVKDDVETLSEDLIDVDASIMEVKECINTTNTSINTINSSINRLDASVQYLYSRIGLPIVRHSESTSIRPNEYNVWDTVTAAMTISLLPPTETNMVNEYIIKINRYVEGAITISANLMWAKGEYPTFVTNHAYEISIIDNFASYIEYYDNL